MSRRLPLTEWKLTPKSCQCAVCQNMCANPCWGTPDEIRRLIKLGYGSKLELEWRAVSGKILWVLSPARKGLEGSFQETIINKNGCNLQRQDGKCSIHKIGKPIEGRLAICEGRKPVDLRDRVTILWDNKAAIALIKEWIEKYGKEKTMLNREIGLADNGC